MERRELGRSGLKVAPWVFGGNVFGWTVPEERAFELLDAFVDAGFNMIDTADVYSSWVTGHTGGESERMVGRWLARSGRRDEVLLATKVGMEMPGIGQGLSRRHIEGSVEASLARLGTDHIDLYQSHLDDPETPLEETLDTYARLIDRGKVRAIGASNHSSARLAEALRVARELGAPRYQSLQPRYNLYDRDDFERDLEALCLGERIGVISYPSLASGFLTGKYRSEADTGKSPRGPRMSRYLNPRGHGILHALDEVAGAHGARPAQVALAWLAARPAVTAPIASVTTPEQFHEIAGAFDLPLSSSDLELLDRASA